MAKPTSPLANIFVQALATEEFKEATSETLSRSYAKFLRTTEGQELVGELKTTVIWYSAIPVGILAFGLGYYIASRRN